MGAGCVPSVHSYPIGGPAVHPLALTTDSPEVRAGRERLEAYLQWGFQQQHYPTMTAGVVVDRELVYEHYIQSHGRRTYALASITKTFTATAIMQLVDRGLVHLDDPITKFFPDLDLSTPGLDSEPILIRHLLSHTSGIPDLRYYDHPDWVSEQESGLEFRVPRQIYPAGRHYRYANHGFMILGAVVEQVSGQPLEEYYRTYIFEPLDMRDAHYGSNLSGAFGIYTSLHDLANYAIMWLNEGRNLRGQQVLSPEAVRMMLEPPLIYPDGTNLPYCGLGWRVHREGNYVNTFFHIGGADGTMTWIQMFPRYRVAILYLGNPPEMRDEVMYRIPEIQHRLGDLATAMVGAPQPVYNYEPSIAGSSLRSRIVGQYQDPLNNQAIEVREEDGRLMASWLRGRTEQIVPVAPRQYQGTASGIVYDFPFTSYDGSAVGIATMSQYFFRAGEQSADKDLEGAHPDELPLLASP